MAVIGATQLEPVNILGSYVQGAELGRANQLRRRQEAVEAQAAMQAQQIRNALASGDRNALMLMGEEGLAAAKTLSELDTAEMNRQKTMSEMEAAQFKRSRDLLPAVTDQAKYDVWRNNALKMYGAIPGIEQLIPEKFSPEVRDQLILTADDIVSRMALSPEQEAQKARIAAAGASRQTVQLPPAESAYQTTVGKASGEADIASFDAAQRASDDLVKDFETINLLQTGKASTGITAELALGINRVKAAVGGDKEAAKKVTDTELLNALLGSDVFSNIQALGVGARGLDTPAEREFLREVVSGTISLNAETLRRMAEIRANVKERAIDRFNQRVEKGELDRFFQATGREKRKIEKPARPKAPEAGGKVFKTEADAEAAFKAGKIKRGDRITIGGVSGTWE
jgi:hypothetical protein